MLGDSSSVMQPASGDDAAAHEGGEIGGGGGEDDKSMSYGANRWPRQETLALLKIRSDMDAVFRDSTPKGPLWEEVSRKLAELGYHRSAKKCKEKFENVYKYHKRTKDGRTAKSDGKTYRFFDQLQALDHTHPSHSTMPPSSPLPPPPPPKQPAITAATTTSLPWTINSTVPSMPNPINTIPQNTITPISAQPITHVLHSTNFPSFQNLSSHLFSSSTSSSTASDEELEGGGGSRKRKRKWKQFFESITKKVLKKQEELQRKFLETIEKQEHERMVREESWRMQETARINREHDNLIQERSTAAAKDAAVLAFLQKISGQYYSLQENPASAPPPPPVPVLVLPQPRPPPAPAATAIVPASFELAKRNNGDRNEVVTSSSRWPKAEIEALIRLRTTLDMKYQENGPKGPLWEDISAGMQKLGYNRSSKRCKEKWENINKYFKKVKESNRKRPEDSKTCPYFHQLEALYKEKTKNNNENAVNLNAAKPVDGTEPVMVRPEQQWPRPMEENQPAGGDHNERGFEDDIDDEEEEIEDDGEEEEEDTEEDEGGFEMVASKPAAMGANGHE